MKSFGSVDIARRFRELALQLEVLLQSERAK